MIRQINDKVSCRYPRLQQSFLGRQKMFFAKLRYSPSVVTWKFLIHSHFGSIPFWFHSILVPFHLAHVHFGWLYLRFFSACLHLWGFTLAFCSRIWSPDLGLFSKQCFRSWCETQTFGLNLGALKWLIWNEALRSSSSQRLWVKAIESIASYL